MDSFCRITALFIMIDSKTMKQKIFVLTTKMMTVSRQRTVNKL
jgi:hypothetical protein